MWLVNSSPITVTLTFQLCTSLTLPINLEVEHKDFEMHPSFFLDVGPHFDYKALLQPS